MKSRIYFWSYAIIYFKPPPKYSRFINCLNRCVLQNTLIYTQQKGFCVYPRFATYYNLKLIVDAQTRIA